MKTYWQPVPHETVLGDTLNGAVAPVLYQPLAGEPDIPLPPPPFVVK